MGYAPDRRPTVTLRQVLGDEALTGLLLRGAFAAGVDTTSSLVGADVTTTAQRPDVAIAAASESSPPATPIPPMSAQPESRVDTATPDRVSGRVDEDFGAEDV